MEAFMAIEIKPGDVVRLKSGGPTMTVTSAGLDMTDVPTVWCAWFDQKGAHQEGAYPAIAVVNVE
jgi:uncharacterized protein YodC (DUF2158 family)